jgi:hypothetical protein
MDRVIAAQAFAAKQRQSPGEAELKQTWQTLRKADCHVESDKRRFGNRPRFGATSFASMRCVIALPRLKSSHTVCRVAGYAT